MNILWFVSDIQRQSAGGLTSKLASVRLRCIGPITGMIEQGIKNNINIILVGAGMKLDPKTLDGVDIAVIGKVFVDIRPLITTLKRHQIPIVIDLCDDPFAMPHLRRVYNGIFEEANAVFCSSHYLADKIDASVETRVIKDIAEDTPESFAFPNAPKSELRLSWFGQPNNLPPLIDQLPNLAKLEFASIKLSIVTRLSDNLTATLQTKSAELPDKLQISLHPWSMEAQLQAVDQSHIVLVPVSNEEWAKSKTANRVMTALSYNRPCAAGDIDSYRELAEYIVINNDLANGINQLVANWDHFKRATAAGRAYIAEHFSKQVIARNWNDALHEIAKAKPAKTTVSARTQPDANHQNPIRLNLGCGDKILKGYINVDLVDERAGNKPDIQCDIRKLTVFDDNYADEILNVHVIEHFYYWEAAEVIKEWVRVLKPGGKMIIECPNLLTACQEIVNNPAKAVKPGKEGQRSMWVLYGDPAWKDPLMCHKWLYTPESLAELMTECGLGKIAREPAQFKLREPRDMRMTGIKL